MEYLVPQPFAARGNGSYLDLLGHNWRPVVPGLQDPTYCFKGRIVISVPVEPQFDINSGQFFSWC
jgi:hypothetical protein